MVEENYSPGVVFKKAQLYVQGHKKKGGLD